MNELIQKRADRVLLSDSIWVIVLSTCMMSLCIGLRYGLRPESLLAFQIFLSIFGVLLLLMIWAGINSVLWLQSLWREEHPNSKSKIIHSFWLGVVVTPYLFVWIVILSWKRSHFVRSVCLYTLFLFVSFIACWISFQWMDAAVFMKRFEPGTSYCFLSFLFASPIFLAFAAGYGWDRGRTVRILTSFLFVVYLTALLLWIPAAGAEDFIILGRYRTFSTILASSLLLLIIPLLTGLSPASPRRAVLITTAFLFLTASGILPYQLKKSQDAEINRIEDSLRARGCMLTMEDMNRRSLAGREPTKGWNECMQDILTLSLNPHAEIREDVEVSKYTLIQKILRAYSASLFMPSKLKEYILVEQVFPSRETVWNQFDSYLEKKVPVTGYGKHQYSFDFDPDQGKAFCVTFLFNGRIYRAVQAGNREEVMRLFRLEKNFFRSLAHEPFLFGAYQCIQSQEAILGQLREILHAGIFNEAELNEIQAFCAEMQRSNDAAKTWLFQSLICQADIYNGFFNPRFFHRYSGMSVFQPTNPCHSSYFLYYFSIRNAYRDILLFWEQVMNVFERDGIKPELFPDVHISKIFGMLDVSGLIFQKEDFFTIKSHFQKVDQDCEMGMIAIEIEKFRLKHDRIPASLDELKSILPDNLKKLTRIQYKPGNASIQVFYAVPDRLIKNTAVGPGYVLEGAACYKNLTETFSVLLPGTEFPAEPH